MGARPQRSGDELLADVRCILADVELVLADVTTILADVGAILAVWGLKNPEFPRLLADLEVFL